MIVDRHRQNALGVNLANHIIVENVTDVAWGRNAFAGLEACRFALLTDNIHTELDTFITDENRRARYQLFHFMLALAAEGTVQRIL